MRGAPSPGPPGDVCWFINGAIIFIYGYRYVVNIIFIYGISIIWDIDM